MSIVSFVDEKAPVLLLGASLVALVRVVQLLIYRYTNPLWNIPGPAPASRILGNIPEIVPKHIDTFQQWIAQYGPTVRIYGMLCVSDNQRLSIICCRIDAYEITSLPCYTQ